MPAVRRRMSVLIGLLLAAATLLGPAGPAQAQTQWVQVSAGGTMTCAIRADSTLWCWGDNSSGALGTGNTSDRNVPVQVSLNWERVRSVSAGTQHVCAATERMALYCWGSNASGQLGISWITGNSPFPALVTPSDSGMSSSVTAVSAGGDHTCATVEVPRDSQAVYCFGNSSTSPTQVAGQSRPVIAAGGGQSCTVRYEGTLFCWGAGKSGQLGTGTTTYQWQPTQVGTSTGWTSVTAGTSHTCGLAGGTAYCWGLGSRGALGTGSTADALTPAPVAAGAGFGSLDAGSDHTCGLIASTAWCWGLNSSGQLGTGGTADSLTPVPVSGGTWRQISAGLAHTCGIDTDYQLWCWGANGSGQLGTGDLVGRLTPAQVG